MQDSLARKDQVLKDYELDLAKLRQAEFLLEKKSEQLDDTQVKFLKTKYDALRTCFFIRIMFVFI